MFTHALLRQPGSDCALGLTRRRQDRADHRRLREQHRRYGAILQQLGLTIDVLPPLHGYPDAYFVEDCAIVTPHVAVITRPGAPSRRGEAAAIIPALAQHRPFLAIQAPGTLDGGDVLMVENSCFIGLSQRTNQAGAKQLIRLLKPYGLQTTYVPVTNGLHLKSGSAM